jgi:hypothetical protein
VQRDGSALEYADPALKKDKAFVQAAMQLNPLARPYGEALLQ